MQMKMDDGRIVTEWTPEGPITYEIKKDGSVNVVG